MRRLRCDGLRNVKTSSHLNSELEIIINQERAAREAAEENNERLRHVTQELRSQLETYKAQVELLKKNTAVGSAVPSRRPDVKPVMRKETSINDDGTSTVSTIPHESNFNVTFHLFQQHLEDLKKSLKHVSENII